MNTRLRHIAGAAWTLIVCIHTAYSESPPATLLGKDGAEMMLVPAGSFIMGTGTGKPEESPPLLIELPAYYIDKTEVTNAQYAKYLTATGAEPPITWNGKTPPAGIELHPVTNVTWSDAMRYAIWAGKRLPTEVEWEKAARGTDGRLYPWGDTDDEARRNLGGNANQLEPVGKRPANASPYGCLDMAGNAWEWTADWYDGYPSTSARTPHFGRQYKAIRGGGAIHYYGVENTARVTARARLVPYGEYDALGFRCVQDVDPARTPYAPKAVLDDAGQSLRAALREPQTLSYEKEYGQYVQSGRVPLVIHGDKGQTGNVRSGIPLPEGLIKNADVLNVVGQDGQQRPLQAATLRTWPDGSPRWVLLDFPATADETCMLAWQGNAASRPGRSLKIDKNDKAITIDTGTATVVCTRGDTIREYRINNGSVLLQPVRLRMELATVGMNMELFPLPAETMELEEAGLLHATVRIQGAFASAGNARTAFRYDVRIHTSLDSSRVNVLTTITHAASRSAFARVLDASVHCMIPAAPGEWLLGADRGVEKVAPGELTQLIQPDDLKYEIVQDGKTISSGTRAAGWLSAAVKDGWLIVGSRHFWQNHPKSLFFTKKSAGIRLWAGNDAFEWEGGLAKTHEIVLDYAAKQPASVSLNPLRATTPPAWACGTEAVAAICPRTIETISRFPYWEVLRQSAMDEWVRAMPSGFRDYGDAYMGGPWKGKNAYSNLEYDVHFNFQMQYLRTGDPSLLQASEVMARHQADIDTDHNNGHPWKHSPLHTTTEAELGHVFTRGLAHHYLMTGERRSLDVAREIGEWLIPETANPNTFNNERWVGWSLYALVGVYEATGDKRYLDVAHKACLKLLEGQNVAGKYTLNYDNRISFFNGIAMNGMLSVYRYTRDEKIAKTILRTARRTLGFYPEYACRTLNGFSWAAEQTRDPRYLDAMERTWSSSMEFYTPGFPGDAVTAETHAALFTRMASRYQLFPLFEAMPQSLPDPSTWRGLRLFKPEIEAYVQGTCDKPQAVFAILEGLSDGTAEMFDSAGQRVQATSLQHNGRLFKPVAFTIPAGEDFYRLRLSSPDAKAWHINSDAGIRISFCDIKGGYLSELYPRAYCSLKPDAKEVTVRLEAMKEGFHMATLYNPEGHPVSTVRHFIDFEDPGRYEMELKAPVSGPTKGWSLELFNVSVLNISGLEPYWACSPGALFNPEQISLQSQPK